METLGRTQSERRRRSLSGMSFRCETHGGRKQLSVGNLNFVEKMKTEKRGAAHPELISRFER